MKEDNTCFIFLKVKHHIVLVLLLFNCFNSIARDVDFYFFGKEIHFNVDINASDINEIIDQERITFDLDQKYRDLLYLDYEELVRSFITNVKELSLDGFGAYLLLDSFVDRHYKDLTNDKKVLFKWFILVESGYSTLLTYDNKGMYLFGENENNLKNVNKLSFNDVKYVQLSNSRQKNKNSVKIFQYNGDVALEKTFTISRNFTANIGIKKEIRKVEFKYKDEIYCFTFQVNKHLIEYYRRLPTVDFGKIYMNYKFSKPLKSTLLPLLSDELQKIESLNERIQFLLFFVQEGIPYKTDLELLQREDWFFPEETLNSVYGDCEDKSILYAFLLKELLQVNSVLLYYDLGNGKSHINVGLLLGTEGEMTIAETTNSFYKLGNYSEDYKLVKPKVYPLSEN